MKYLKKIENINTLSYEDYLILEGRKEDLEKRFIKDLGKGLGEVVFGLDTTENKAYSEWLINFFKNNREILGISDEMNKPRKEMDKVQYRKDVDKLDILERMIKKYHNNKKHFNKPITQIRTIADFKSLLDKKDGFDKLEDYPKEDVIVYHNGLEWLVFQPFTYEISELANKKDRENNWCTTYDEGHFDSYLGKKGTLLYCVNKLDSTQDLAFQLRPNQSIIPWDYKDNSRNTLYSFYDMKDEFEKGSEIYDILDEVEHKIDFPHIDKKQLREDVINYYDSWGGFGELNIDKDLYLELLDGSNYLEDFILNEIDYYHKEFITDFLPSYDDELNFTFKFIWQNASNGFTEYFNFPKVGFWKSEGYPDINDFKDALEDPERLKKLEMTESTEYSTNDIYKEIETYLDDKGVTGDLVETYFRKERFDGYSSKDFIDEYHHSVDDMSSNELTDIGGEYVDWDDYVEALVNRMDEDEMMELAYPE